MTSKGLFSRHLSWKLCDWSCAHRPVTPPAIQRCFPRWEVVRYLSPRVPWPYPDDGAAGFEPFRSVEGEGWRMVWLIEREAWLRDANLQVHS